MDQSQSLILLAFEKITNQRYSVLFRIALIGYLNDAFFIPQPFSAPYDFTLSSFTLYAGTLYTGFIGLHLKIFFGENVAWTVLLDKKWQ